MEYANKTSFIVDVGRLLLRRVGEYTSSLHGLSFEQLSYDKLCMMMIMVMSLYTRFGVNIRRKFHM